MQLVADKLDVLTGQRVFLRCPDSGSAANIVWTYRANLTDQNYKDIYLHGEVINGNKKRIEMDYSSPGDLIIPNVASSDTGIYTCTVNDGQGFSYHMHLDVSCRSAFCSRICTEL